MNPDNFAEQFKALRIASGLTQSQAAAMFVDSKPATIKAWESGSLLPSESVQFLVLNALQAFAKNKAQHEH